MEARCIADFRALANIGGTAFAKGF